MRDSWANVNNDAAPLGSIAGTWFRESAVGRAVPFEHPGFDCHADR
jgi:hypothetical protein